MILLAVSAAQFAPAPTVQPASSVAVLASRAVLAFDADLKSRHPAWGLRRLADVAMQARAAGLTLKERVPMPANNLLLAWTRAGAANGGSV